MAEAVVSYVGGKLGDLLTQEANFLGGVSEQINQMKMELRLMQSFLKDADKRQEDDKTVQVWVSEIREAAYEVEDVIETYILEIASKKRGGIQNKMKRCACIISETQQRHNVGSKIEIIKNRLSCLRASLQTYGITTTSQGEGSNSAHAIRLQPLRRSYSHVVEEFTVGLAEDAEKLVEQLVNEDKHCGVVSIYGMGGLGKTTLAKKVYHHNIIRRYFDAFAWAAISQQCQPRDAWEGILFTLLSPSKEEREEIERLRYQEVAKKLYNVLLEKKCLVVIDDIWSIEAWESLSPGFPVGKAGSKMLLTTRIKAVAQCVDGGNSFLHAPQVLTEQEGWELLKKKAFPRRDDLGTGLEIKADMEALGRKMVGRCAGLPLAIIVLGGLLATKRTLNEWNIVNENVDLYLTKGKGNEVSKVLALSYHELSYQFKPCFLHLVHFPEDSNIPIEKLVRIWVAEGIVSPEPSEVGVEETLEDVANRYLGELMDRCLVEIGDMDLTGKILSCRLHDLMRDFCMSKANEENFLKIVGQDRYEPNNLSSSTVSTPRSDSNFHRLGIYLKDENFSWESLITPSVRSLLSFRINSDDYPKIKVRFSDFKLLKVLDLEYCCISGKLSKAIGNLIHLKYLNLNCSWITKIPSCIGNLRRLQTLILIGHSRRELIKVPNVIWKMEELRHLKVDVVSGSKLRLGNLSNLQTLEVRGIGIDAKELTKLSTLKTLVIAHGGLKSVKELEGILLSPTVTLNRLCSLMMWMPESIEEKDLEMLLLGGCHLRSLKLIGKIERLPENSHFPPNLTKLILHRSKLEEDPMPTLEKLPHLIILEFWNGAFKGKEMICASKGGFPHLKSLLLGELDNLEEWRVGEEAMPSLCELQIRNCHQLMMVPNGLRFITTLRQLKVINMPEEFEDRVKEGGDDFHKVQHVPSILITGRNTR